MTISVVTAGGRGPTGPVTFRQDRGPWSTPRRLLVLGALAVVLTAALGPVIATAASTASAEVTVIGEQAAPQVSVATDLSFALGDLDAQAANALLVGAAPAMASARTAALNTYNQRLAEADNDLQQAAADGGTDPVAQQVVRTTLNRLATYQSLVSQALLLSQQGADPIGAPSATVLAHYRDATDLMQTMLVSVQQLVDHNHDILESAYASDSSGSTMAQLRVAVVGALLVATLVSIQIQLRRRQRRRLNPALLAGTVIALLVSVLGLTALGNAASQLYVAKQQAFDSVIALAEARAVSDDANADESRYLLDPQRAEQYQQAFLAKMQTLARFGDATDLVSYDGDLATAVQQYQVSMVVLFDGYFSTGLTNLTFPNAQNTAKLTFGDFGTYLTADQHLRELATSGDRAGAITFDIGTAPGDSDYAFNAYDSHLAALIQINQTAYTTAIDDARSGLSGWSAPVPIIGALLVVALLGLGLWPRIAEYRNP